MLRRGVRSTKLSTLLIGDSPLMADHARVEAGFLTSLAAKPGGLQNFFAQVHVMVETGMTLDEVRRTMAAEAFWKGVGVVYNEVKGLFSFTLNAGS